MFYQGKADKDWSNTLTRKKTTKTYVDLYMGTQGT